MKKTIVKCVAIVGIVAIDVAMILTKSYTNIGLILLLSLVAICSIGKSA